jgi:GTP cyclohydrolase I
VVEGGLAVTSAARTVAEPARPALRVAPPHSEVDMAAAEQAAAAFLRALGVDADAEGLRATPGRMARAYAELFNAPEFDLTTFPNDEGYDELVLARSIPMRSVCEHHLLPFVGVAHVGYLPGERILGLSKLARVVGHFAARWARCATTRAPGRSSSPWPAPHRESPWRQTCRRARRAW